MLRLVLALLFLSSSLFDGVFAQEEGRLFPPRSLFPTLLAGPRDPVTSATLLGVLRNPSRHGPGVEAEVSIGSTLPVFLLGGTVDDSPIVVGLEAAAFARFGLQVLQREMVATDWLFAIPLIWHHRNGWTRIRYYHSSAHLADEYSRRFGEVGFNSSRDAAEVLLFRNPAKDIGIWAGLRYGYNVHPEDDKRWVLRAGGQVETETGSGRFPSFLAADLEWDQAADTGPRVEMRLGGWLPEVRGRRAIRLSLVALVGPSPLGQFDYEPTTQIGLSLQGSF